MTTGFEHPHELCAIKAAVDALRREMEDDRVRMRQLPEGEIATVLRLRTDASRAAAADLVRRVKELREIISLRVRTLNRLRARMWQIRGGRRPH